MEHETFWTLIKDAAHWEFELFLIFIFDIIIGLFIWPYIRSFKKHHKSDDQKIANLEKELIELKDELKKRKKHGNASRQRRDY